MLGRWKRVEHEEKRRGFEDGTEEIVGALMEVHRHLGPDPALRERPCCFASNQGADLVKIGSHATDLGLYAPEPGLHGPEPVGMLPDGRLENLEAHLDAGTQVVDAGTQVRDVALGRAPEDQLHDSLAVRPDLLENNGQVVGCICR
jgi:hypothetical protein